MSLEDYDPDEGETCYENGVDCGSCGIPLVDDQCPECAQWASWYEEDHREVLW